MKATFARSYKKNTTGNTVFVYVVKGTAKELESYAKAQGDRLVIDEKTGETLWFTTRFVGQTADLIITSNDKVVADMSKFDQADSLARQYGGNLGEQIARASAEALLGITPTPASVPAPNAPAES